MPMSTKPTTGFLTRLLGKGKDANAARAEPSFDLPARDFDDRGASEGSEIDSTPEHAATDVAEPSIAPLTGTAGAGFRFGKASKKASPARQKTAQKSKKAKEPKPPKAPRAPRAPRAGRSPRVRRSRDNYDVLTHAGMLDSLSRRKVVLCAHTVFATLDAHRPAPSTGFIAQEPRQTMSPLRAMFARGPAALRVSVDGRLLQRPKTRYALALDGYLAWGRRHGGGSTVVLGGGEQAGQTYLEIYVFQDKVLVEFMERELPAAGASAFPITISTLLDELRTRYPQPRIVACQPLPDWELPDIEYIGDRPLRSLTFHPLAEKSASGTNLRPAVFAASTGLLVYGALLGSGWSLYASARSRYQMEANDQVLASAGGIDNARLESMQQQRLFMELERPQDQLVQRSRLIVAGIAALPDVRIDELTFHGAAAPAVGDASPPETAQTTPTDGADVSIKIVVKADQANALEQAKSVMQRISRQTGLELRLESGGWTDDATAGTRTLRIEGFLQ